jgi:carbonic anhydrase
MSNLQEMLTFNEEFVKSKKYEEFITDKFPDKRMVILTCMDTRLSDLLPRALNLRNGDAKIVKNAGALVSHPFGSIMRSILVAIYALNANEVMVIGHHDCGITALNSEDVLQKAKLQGIPDNVVDTLTNSGIDLNRWLTGFEDVEEAVAKSVSVIRNHPLLPPNITVHGLIIHPETGKLDLVVDGSVKAEAPTK